MLFLWASGIFSWPLCASLPTVNVLVYIGIFIQVYQLRNVLVYIGIFVQVY